MDTDDERAILRVHERLAALAERVASLAEHKAGAHELSKVEQGARDGDFRVLQEISGQISNLRQDMREWTGNTVEAAETRIMAAIKADRSWQKQLPTYIMIGLAAAAILTGNPHVLRLLSTGAP